MQLYKVVVRLVQPVRPAGSAYEQQAIDACWQARYARVRAAERMRAMPENEIPTAPPGDHYIYNH